MNTLSVVTRRPEDTRELAGRLLRELPGRSVYALYGGLGSGKTCFVQGMAAELGVLQAVTSPTFTLVREYTGGKSPLYHFDLYRLAGPEEVVDIGFEEYLRRGGVVAVEWAERAEELFPNASVRVRFEAMQDPDSRLISVVYGS